MVWIAALLASIFISSAIELAGLPGEILEIIAVAGFLSLAYVLLLMRDVLIPLRRRYVLRVAPVLLAAATVLLVGISYGASESEGLSPTAQALLLAIMLSWALCIADPALRFFRIARGLPTVQRARLKLIATAYLLVAGIAIVTVSLPDDPTGASDTVTSLYGSGLVVLFWCALTPPEWLRRYWRSNELERLLEGSSTFYTNTDARALAGTALDWATLLVGASDGTVRGPDGTVFAERGDPQRPGERITIPLHMAAGQGELVVVAGSLTPPFTDADRRLLDHYSAGIVAGLDRATLEEARLDFVTAMSHEFRTPLTNIVGAAETLIARLDTITSEPAVGRMLQLINRNGWRMERLLGEFVDLDRLRRGKLRLVPEMTDVAAIVQAEIARWDTDGRQVHFETVPVRTSVDASSVRRIVGELLANVDKHTPRTSNVWVTVDAIDDGVAIEVADDGPGIPAHQRETLFRPFVRGANAPSDSPGTAVGLALVSGLAALHGGRAWADERPGGGSRIRVTLGEL